jgi:hypothetical protein
MGRRRHRSCTRSSERNGVEHTRLILIPNKREFLVWRSVVAVSGIIDFFSAVRSAEFVRSATASWGVADVAIQGRFQICHSGVHAQVLDFPAAITCASDLDEARRLLGVALVDVAEAAVESGQALPVPHRGVRPGDGHRGADLLAHTGKRRGARGSDKGCVVPAGSDSAHASSWLPSLARRTRSLGVSQPSHGAAECCTSPPRDHRLHRASHLPPAWHPRALIDLRLTWVLPGSQDMLDEEVGRGGDPSGQPRSSDSPGTLIILSNTSGCP